MEWGVRPPPPDAPVSNVVSGATSDVIFVACLIAFAAVVVWALVDWRRSKTPVMLACLAGGMTSIIIEPFLDLLGRLWFPEQDTLVGLRALGIAIPAWGFFMYPLMFGLVPALLHRFLARRPTRRQFWTVALCLFVGEALFQILLLPLDVLSYYGRQPFQVLGFPLQWVFIDMSMCVLVAAVLVVFRPLLLGPRLFLTVLLFPCLWGGVLLAVGWPTFIAIHSAKPLWFLDAASLLTIGLSLCVFAGVAAVCCRDGSAVGWERVVTRREAAAGTTTREGGPW